MGMNEVNKCYLIRNHCECVCRLFHLRYICEATDTVKWRIVCPVTWLRSKTVAR